MRNCRLIKLLLLAIAFTYSTAGASSNLFNAPSCAPDIRELPIVQIQAVSPGNVHLSTAVLIGKDTWSTSSHSMADGKATKITLFLPGIREVEGKLLWFDKASDRAVVMAPSGNLKPIRTTKTNVKKHEQVWTIGFPGLTRGEMLSFTGMFLRYNKRGLIVANSLALKGMSGGAIVRCVKGKPEIFGVITNLINHTVQMKVWTDETGILHQSAVITNSGVSLSAPLRAQ